MKLLSGIQYYITLRLYFPDGDVWVNQFPCEAESFHSIMKEKGWPDNITAGLLREGRSEFTDRNKVIHEMTITKTKVNKVWGVKPKEDLHGSNESAGASSATGRKSTESNSGPSCA